MKNCWDNIVCVCYKIYGSMKLKSSVNPTTYRTNKLLRNLFVIYDRFLSNWHIVSPLSYYDVCVSIYIYIQKTTSIYIYNAEYIYIYNKIVIKAVEPANYYIY